MAPASVRDSPYGPTDDGGEDCFKVERRVYRLANLAECLNSPTDCANSFVRSRSCIEKPRVLDGDDGLGGEVRDQGDLLVGKGTDFLARQG